MKKIHNFVATVCGMGYLPLAPGTWGSLAGLFFVILLHEKIVLYSAFFLICFILGVISSGALEKEAKIKDPRFVVIDEFAGIFIAFLLIPINPLILFIGFLLYRFIDIVKLPPMRGLEKLELGWGIMLDDLVGGIYTNLLLRVLLAVFPVLLVKS